MDELVVITSTVAPVELATADLSQIMYCSINSFQNDPKDVSTIVQWNMVNISKRMDYENKWYLEDTICHNNIPFSQEVSISNINAEFGPLVIIYS